MIAPLSQELAKLLSAQYVSQSLPHIVQELIENAIDASANTISIILEDQGKKRVLVQDNGCGMCRQDLSRLGQVGMTSKLQKEEQMQELKSLGFRGKAISSISILSSLTIQTCKLGKAFKRTFDDNKIEPSSLREGTLVTIENLFKNIPVRKIEFNQAKGLSGKIVQTVKDYSVANPCISFKVNAYDNQKLEPLFGVLKHKSLIARLTAIYGQSIQAKIVPINTQFGQGFTLREVLSGSVNQSLSKNVQMLIHGCRSLPLPRSWSSALYKVYRQFNPRAKIFFVFKIILDKFDINSDPEKKVVMFQGCDRMCEVLKQALAQITQSSIKSLSPQKESAIIPTKNKPTLTSQEVKIIRKSVPTRNEQFESFCQARPSCRDSKKITIKRQSLEVNNKPTQLKGEKIIQVHKEIVVRDILFEQEKKPSTPRSPKLIEMKTPSSSPCKNKSIFSQLQILGQFNKGFILCLLKEQHFLIDQHAASQKWFYEDFIGKQIQAAPIPPYSVNNLFINTQNASQLKRSGFEVQLVDGEWKVLTHGFFMDLQLDQSDFNELLEQLEFWNGAQRLIPKRVLQKAASKACRTAIKIGDELDRSQMIRLVRGLDQLQSPWNCPHGRPTLVRLQGHTISYS